MKAFLWIFVLYSLKLVSAIIDLKCSFVLQAFKFKVLWFQGKVKNEMIMTSWNGLHKLLIAISGKTPKPYSVFELRHQRWLGYEPQIKKIS